MISLPRTAAKTSSDSWTSSRHTAPEYPDSPRKRSSWRLLCVEIARGLAACLGIGPIYPRSLGRAQTPGDDPRSSAPK
eukprot:5626547-Pyramimonas_sp.AAC.1